MKLANILLEQNTKPKALIMSGGGGSGKSYILSKINTGNLPLYNPDSYVEDPNSSMFGNLAAASTQTKKDVADAVDDRKSFIFDTTGRNIDMIRSIKEAGYDVLVVMVYTHPIISFLSNFERKRSLPKSAVFSTWQQSYDLVDDYRRLLKNNFILVSNLRGGEYEKKIKDFNKAAEKGGKGILQYLDSIVSMNPEKYQTSFSKDFDITDPEALEAYNKEVEGLKFDETDSSMVKQLKRHFMKSWNAKNIGPGRKSMNTRIKSIERTRNKAAERHGKVMNDIAKMVLSSKFNKMLNPLPQSEAIFKANQFLK